MRGVVLLRSALFLLCALPASFANAQLNSAASQVQITAVLPETLTLSVTPSTVNVALIAGGAATASAPLSVTTSWVLTAARSAIHLYGWFATPSAALTDGASTPNLIPSSVISGQMTTGIPTSYTAFTQSNALGAANGGLALLSQAITSGNRATTRSDTFTLKIDLSTLPQLPAGTYSGTLTLQIQSL